MRGLKPARAPSFEKKLGEAKKALIVFPHDAMGGAERVTRTVAYAALQSGRFDEVTCFVLSRGNTGTLEQLSKLPGARMVYSGARRMARGLPGLVRVCRQARYDFTFCSFADINAILCLFRGLGILKTRRLVTRESTMMFERDFGWKTPIARLLYRAYGRQDLIVCQTARMAASLTKNTDGRFREITAVIPNPLDFDAVQALCAPGDNTLDQIPAARRKIVWCGRLVPVKAPLRAVETLAELHGAGLDDTHLVMIGEGPMRAEVEALAERLDLSAHLTLTGFHRLPVTLMRACRAGLVTSEIEGFPNVILEMLFAGVPGVASTDCAGGLAEIPGLVLSDEKTATSLARAVVEVLSLEKPAPQTAPHIASRRPESFFSRLCSV
jgi:glycosyltransferase involved in cell wall biosynthesis